MSFYYYTDYHIFSIHDIKNCNALFDLQYQYIKKKMKIFCIDQQHRR